VSDLTPFYGDEIIYSSNISCVQNIFYMAIFLVQHAADFVMKLGS
jgi:hypothetical protein